MAESEESEMAYVGDDQGTTVSEVDNMEHSITTAADIDFTADEHFLPEDEEADDAGQFEIQDEEGENEGNH